MVGRELGITATEAWLTVVVAAGLYVAMIIYSRLFGQRQFSRLSTFDLVAVFAMGSIIGRAILVRTSLAVAALGLLALFAVHAFVGFLHHHFQWLHNIIENRPILLAADSRILHDNVKAASTSEEEIYQQMRLKGITRLDEVRAVILERNGSFAIIPVGKDLEPDVFRHVVGSEHLLGEKSSSGR